MKKTLASITVFSYLVMSSGIVVNFHYCMNRLATTKLFASESKFCPQCGMHTQKSKSCCHDEVKVIKLHQDQNIAQVVHSLQAPEAMVAIPSDFLVAEFYPFYETNQFLIHSPPLLTGQYNYLQNCVFRI